eukprot:Hpha_TRINITY_DN10636_c0_g1::TRINITY_DN10636_c0_g1_i1::g.156885::m.156885
MRGHGDRQSSAHSGEGTSPLKLRVSMQESIQSDPWTVAGSEVLMSEEQHTWLPEQWTCEMGYRGVVGYAAVLLGVLGLSLYSPDNLWGVGCAVAVGVGSALVAMHFSQRLTSLIPYLEGAGLCGAVLLCDITAAAQLQARLWPLLLVVIGRIRSHVGLLNIVCALGVLVLLLERCEAMWRGWGLYEAALWEADPLPDVCNCSKPPCSIPVGHGVFTTLVTLAAIVGCRGVLSLAEKEWEGRRSEVDGLGKATSEIIDLMLMSDTNAAVDKANELGDLVPHELRVSLQHLSEALLVWQRNPLAQSKRRTTSIALPGDYMAKSSIIMPPGLDGDTSNVSLVFTDIQSSTALWDMFPQAMYDGLQQHNKVVRLLLADHKGYEVKVIGDAFMLAFAGAYDACAFALELQERLLEAQWPDELLLSDTCKRVEGPNGDIIWNGLRVRAGINAGEVKVLNNPVTRRTDYFGTVVNVAARVEGAMKWGGLTGVTQSFLERLSPEDLQSLGSPSVHPLGPTTLKGVREVIPIHVMLPPKLTSRWEATRDMTMAASTIGPSSGAAAAASV